MRKATGKPKLVLVHGWGLNNAIWQPIVERASDIYDLISIDLSGYGRKAKKAENSTESADPTSIEELAKTLLKDVNTPAHWCAWSLGGMAALQASIDQPDQFLSLSLVCTTPKFVQSEDWPMGVDIDIFQRFADQLKADYQTGIQQFLLLQAGSGPQARTLAKSAAKLLSKYPDPTAETLQSGLEILRKTDLRTKCQSISSDISCQVISGKRDRVIHPSAGRELSEMLPNADYRVLNSGHAPLLSCPDELMFLLSEHISNAENALIKST